MYTVQNLFWFLLIGGLAGFLAGKIVRGHGFGVVWDVLIGVVGGVLGGFIFAVLGLTSVTLLGSLVTATAGSVVLVWIMRRFRRA